MFTILGRAVHHIAAIAGIIAAIYAVLAFHSSGEKLQEARQEQEARMRAIVNTVPSPNLKAETDFHELDMNVKLRLSFERRIPHKPGVWQIPVEIEQPMQLVLEGIRRELLDDPRAEVSAGVLGTADPIPIAEGWRYFGPGVSALPVRYADNREATIEVEHASLMTNEKLACLRAHEAGEIVARALGVQPALAAFVSPAVGDRFAVVRLHIENALLDDFEQMNRLERDITRAGFTIKRLRQTIFGAAEEDAPH